MCFGCFELIARYSSESAAQSSASDLDRRWLLYWTRSDCREAPDLMPNPGCLINRVPSTRVRADNSGNWWPSVISCLTQHVHVHVCMCWWVYVHASINSSRKGNVVCCMDNQSYVCRTLYSKYSIVDGVNLVSHQLDSVQTRLITDQKLAACCRSRNSSQKHSDPRYRIINPKQTAPNCNIDKNR